MSRIFKNPNTNNVKKIFKLPYILKLRNSPIKKPIKLYFDPKNLIMHIFSLKIFNSIQSFPNKFTYPNHSTDYQKNFFQQKAMFFN